MNKTLENQLNNWQNLCQYHLGSWHGTWRYYTPDGQLQDEFLVIRCFMSDNEQNTIYHHNHYIYANGKTETKIFGPYAKPETRSLFLNNAFSWGTSSLSTGEGLLFEIGFRQGDRRASAGLVYDEAGIASKAIAISENLNHKLDLNTFPPILKSPGNLLGKQQTMTADLAVSQSVDIEFKPIENLQTNHKILQAFEELTLSFPPDLNPTEDFQFIVDWSPSSDYFQRGIRVFHQQSFNAFRLETFAT